MWTTTRTAITVTNVIVLGWFVASSVAVAILSAFGRPTSVLSAESTITTMAALAIGFVWLPHVILYWPRTRLKPAAWSVWLALNGVAAPFVFASSQSRSSAATSIGVAVTLFVAINAAVWVAFALGRRSFLRRTRPLISPIR
ncbi:MAG: hypothetical protein ACE5GC_08640 [Acidimicrobiia bacterium]